MTKEIPTTSGLEQLIRSEISPGNQQKVTFKIGGDCEILNICEGGICLMIPELINNCLEKPAADLKVEVSLGYQPWDDTFRLEVKDNVPYSNVSRVIKKLNKIEPDYSVEKPGAASHKITRPSEGGLGIKLIKRMLRDWDGILVYTEENNTVVGTAFWNKTKFISWVAKHN